jgi:putative protein kinase ArgK-like GTPase of G3E family
VALDDTGIDELIAAIAGHRQHLADGDTLTQLERQHIEIELHDRLREALMARFLKHGVDRSLSQMIERVQAREIDPQSAVREILNEHLQLAGDNTA